MSFHKTPSITAASRWPRIFWHALALLGIGLFQQAFAGTPQTIAYTGVAAPGTGGKTFYSQVLSTFPIARGNSIVFEHRTSASDYGLWRWENGVLSKIIYKGEALPGSTDTYLSLYKFSVDDNGKVAFGAFEGLFYETSTGQLAKIFLRDQQAPGYAGKFGPAYELNYRNGQVSFYSELSTTNPGRGIWRGTSTGIQPAMIETQTLANSDVIQTVNEYAPANGINSSFALVTLGPTLNDTILRQSGTSVPQIVAKGGESAPGLAVERYLGINTPISNSAGQVIYTASLTGGTVSTGLFRDLGIGPQLLVGTNSRVPNSPAGRLQLIDEPQINNSGTAAFRGSLFDSSLTGSEGKTGIWKIDVAGTLQEIVRNNMTSIVDLPGVSFSGISADYALGNSGQVAWLGTVTGPGITASNNSGLWATLPNGQHVTVVREGDVIQVRPGVTRTVSSVSIGLPSSTYSPYASSWTDDGNLVYTLTFSDFTTGIFVSAVPEPGTVTLMGCIVVVVGYRIYRLRKNSVSCEHHGSSVN